MSGEVLDIVHRNYIPSRTRAHTWIRPNRQTNKKIYICFMSQIRNFQQKTGRLGEKDDGRRSVVFKLSAESIPIINKTNCRVQWGFSHIRYEEKATDSSSHIIEDKFIVDTLPAKVSESTVRRQVFRMLLCIEVKRYKI